MSILIKHFLLQLSKYRIIRLGEFSYSDVPNRPANGVGPDQAQQIAASDLGRRYSLLVSCEKCRPRLGATSCGV